MPSQQDNYYLDEDGSYYNPFGSTRPSEDNKEKEERKSFWENLKKLLDDLFSIAYA